MASHGVRVGRLVIQDLSVARNVELRSLVKENDADTVVTHELAKGIVVSGDP